MIGGFPGAEPRSTEPDEPVQPDQQDRIESGTTIPVAERYMLEPADQQQSAVETIESSEATTDEVFMSEKEEEKVKSESGEGDERVKAESEGSGAKGVKTKSDGSKGESSEGVMRTKSIDDDLRESPAFKFITRPDLYKFAKVIMCLPVSTPFFSLHLSHPHILSLLPPLPLPHKTSSPSPQTSSPSPQSSSPSP